MMATEAVKSAQRALQILEHLTEREEPLTFTEIADSLRFPRSSLHGLLRTLLDAGWVQFDETTRRYTLGLRTLEAGNAYTRALGLPDRARPHMERVRDALNETVQLSILDGRYNVYIAKVEGHQPLRLASEVGRRLPAHATGLGKALLAELPARELEERIGGARLEGFTPHTITTKSALRAELDDIRHRGYASDNEEYSIGVRCVAVAVRDRTGRADVAMSVSAPTIRFDSDRRERALTLLREAATRLSTALGYEGEATDVTLGAS